MQKVQTPAQPFVAFDPARPTDNQSACPCPSGIQLSGPIYTTQEIPVNSLPDFY